MNAFLCPFWDDLVFFGPPNTGALLTLTLGLLILGRMPRVRQPGYLVMGGLVALVTTGVLVLIDAFSIEQKP